MAVKIAFLLSNHCINKPINSLEHIERITSVQKVKEDALKTEFRLDETRKDYTKEPFCDRFFYSNIQGNTSKGLGELIA